MSKKTVGNFFSTLKIYFYPVLNTLPSVSTASEYSCRCTKCRGIFATLPVLRIVMSKQTNKQSDAENVKELFQYNTHNSVQAEPTAAVELV